MLERMGEFEVTRWRRYGKDRLYVTSSDGHRLGWVDLVTGSVSVEDVSRADVLQEAVQTWCAANGVPLRTSGSDPEPSSCQPALSRIDQLPPDPVSTETPQLVEVTPAVDWTDLVHNRPGQAARAQARAELAVMKDRSRIITFLARAMDVKTDERAWRVGADGEETVGARLDKLTGHGWHVLHAIPVGNRGSDIDHVLIGPGGVFSVNTKKHPSGAVWVGRGSVLINGQRTDYLRNSRHEAKRASRLLTEAISRPVLVQAVLVFVTGRTSTNITIKQQPDDVLVLERGGVPRAFRRAPRRLDDEEISLIFGAARRSTTWQPIGGNA